MLNSMFARALGERQMPLSMMVGRLWANTAGQVSLLQYAIAAPPEVFTFEGSEHRQAPMEALVLMNRWAGTAVSQGHSSVACSAAAVLWDDVRFVYGVGEQMSISHRNLCRRALARWQQLCHRDVPDGLAVFAVLMTKSCVAACSFLWVSRPLPTNPHFQSHSQSRSSRSNLLRPPQGDQTSPCTSGAHVSLHVHSLTRMRTSSKVRFPMSPPFTLSSSPSRQPQPGLAEPGMFHKHTVDVTRAHLPAVKYQFH